jgi:IS4 transposase
MWRLLTNRSVDTLQQATELIDWYRARWEIEMFFLILRKAARSSSCSWKTSSG